MASRHLSTMRAFLRRSKCPRLRSNGCQRSYVTKSSSASSSDKQWPQMRYLSPIIWTIAAVGTFYVGFAAYDVYKDAQKVKKRRLHPNSEITWNDVESGKTTAFIRDMFSKQARDPPSLDDLFSPTAMSAYFNQLSGPEKLKWGALGLNTGFFALSTLSPDFAFKLCHVPVLSRNYTLLTCTFGHTGLLHLGMNMYCLLNFFPPVANSKTFEGNSSHLAAFYLSSGVVASLAYHLSAGWPSPALRYAPGLGASGVIYAFLGAFGVQYPEAPVGIIFLPFSFAARDALAALALFDAYGLFVGYKSIKFAHAAHLGGMAVGAAYVYLDGKNTLWKPARKVAFRQMKMLGMI